MEIENNVKHTKQQKLPTKSVWKSTTDIAIGNITLQKISIQTNNKSFATPTQTNSYQPLIDWQHEPAEQTEHTET